MQIQFSYDSSVGSAPTGFTQALKVAASYLDHLFVDPITVTINVGYGEITQSGATTSVTSGALGGTNDDAYWTLAQTQQNYAAHVTSADQAGAYSEILAATSLADDYIDISSAQEKALGQISANASGSDGSVGFQTNGAGGVYYDFNPLQRGAFNEWDFIGVALHEISHALGRISDVGMGGVATLLDMFRYQSAGQLQTNPTGSPAYFSLNGGATNIANFDSTNQDPADWSGNGNDANNAFGSLSVANNFGQADLRELNALGFTRRAQIDDFNGDGTSDLVWWNSSTGAISEWQFANAAHTQTLSLGTKPAYQPIASGDFNGDGTSDLLFMDAATGDVIDWLMNTSGQQARGAISLGNMAGYHATVGYFRGGNVSSIIWQNTSTSAITEWIMGAGAEKRSVSIYANAGWNVIGSGDFNGDGSTDLLMQAPSGNVWDWILTNGRHTSGNLLGAMTGWTYLGSGDFNGDGTSDMLWRNNATNDVQEWLMSNGLIGSQVDLGTVSGANVVATGDYFGIGTSGIVWQNAATGATTMWAMLNGQHMSTYDVNLGATSGLKGV